MPPRLPTRSPLLALVLGVMLLAGCTGIAPAALAPAESRPLRRLEPGQVVVPARMVGHYLLVEATIDGAGPFTFLVDTGSTITLVSERVAGELKDYRPAAGSRPVRVVSATGGAAVLGSTVLSSVELGTARFADVRAAVFDFGDFSRHLGVPVDGLLGFPVFRDVLLTLDYPRSRILVTPRIPARAFPGTAVPFATETDVPLVSVGLAGRNLLALLDSGSDGALNLNPVGLEVRFRHGPRPGPVVASVAGERPQLVGRLADPLQFGTFEVAEPVVTITDQLSSIGGAILRHFTITFDQHRHLAILQRDGDSGPIVLPGRRSTGLSFARQDGGWVVAGVIAQTPAARSGVRLGDLVVAIDGEPVEAWNFQRYEAALRTAARMTFMLRRGTAEFALELPVFDLVP